VSNVMLIAGARLLPRSIIFTPLAYVVVAARPVPPKGNFSREAAEY